MGASESKLVFKKGIFRLQDTKAVAADDTYWTGFWQLPESTEDVFTLFSAADIRRTRDAALPNLETLILALTSRLFYLVKHPRFPHAEVAPAGEALNCIRVLTRVLPYIYEADNLDTWEDQFFWTERRTRRKRRDRNSDALFDAATENEKPRPKESAEGGERGGDKGRHTNVKGNGNGNGNNDGDDGDQDGNFEATKPLAEELIDTLIDLLFFADFTISRHSEAKAKITYSIWTSGIGCIQSPPSSSQLEANRTEVTRLLLTLASKSMYMPANVLPLKGVRAITYIVTCPEKQIVLSMLCSFLNTSLKFDPNRWRVPYDHMVVGDPQHLYIASSLQFLLVLLLYPVPEGAGTSASGSSHKNFFRHFLGRIHRAEDFQFICDGLHRTLKQPLTATTSYLPGSRRPVRWASEMLMLFWELIQCNKKFRSFVVDTDRGADFLILILFYATEYRADPTKQGIVRMCVFIMQTLSVEPGFGAGLNKRFLGQDTLPPALRLDNWAGTYGDFLIISLYTLITGSGSRLDTVYPALLAVLNNIAPYLEHINKLSCYKIIQLYVRMSSPSFLLANETNHQLLTALLEAMNAVVEHKYDENEELVANILKHRRRFESLRNFTLETAQEEVERVRQRRKESGAHDLEPLSAASSRRGSLDSVRAPATPRTPQLSNVPEESAFTLGDDSDEEETGTAAQRTSSRASRGSRNASISSIEQENAEDAVPIQLRGMSEKARGKMPANRPAFSRVNSMSSVSSHQGSSSGAAMAGSISFMPSPAWVDTWLPTLPLHTILTLIRHTATHQPQAPNQPPPALPPGIEAENSATRRVHMFEWSPLSLGWYESLLWSLICSSEMIVGSGSGPVGVWNGTSIRLFRLEAKRGEGPSLMAPRGAIDAVGNGIVQRLGGLGLGGTGAGAGTGPGTGTGASAGGTGGTSAPRLDHTTTGGRRSP